MDLEWLKKLKMLVVESTVLPSLFQSNIHSRLGSQICFGNVDGQQKGQGFPEKIVHKILLLQFLKLDFSLLSLRSMMEPDNSTSVNSTSVIFIKVSRVLFSFSYNNQNTSTAGNDKELTYDGSSYRITLLKFSRPKMNCHSFPNLQLPQIFLMTW